MKRKIYSTLLEWKRTSNGKSAIMLDGVRRDRVDSSQQPLHLK